MTVKTVDVSLLDRVVSAFERRYGCPPAVVVRAPGRINLIGEHTDYNEGFVLPLAIDRAVWVALRPVSSNHVQLYSLDFEEEESFALNVGSPPRGGVGAGRWIEYVKGVAWALADSGHSLRGWQGVVTSDVPISAGLSSSAALEMAAARSFAWACGIDWEPVAMARLAQRAENDWVGVNCGIMDQLVCAVGRKNHAVLLDCRTLDVKHIRLPPDIAVVALDTGTRRRLADSAFNERRGQCEAAAAAFGVSALRDVRPDHFSARAEALVEPVRRRARHVIGENARTLDAAQALMDNDPQTVGNLMYASHISLRDDFEVSTSTLDQVVEYARSRPECHGARMTGAGFGGCVVALVDERMAERLTAQANAEYERSGRQNLCGYVFRAADGVSCRTV